MAITTQQMYATRLRHDSMTYTHALLISLMILGGLAGIRKASAPIFGVAQGISVPISRGSPPIS